MKEIFAAYIWSDDWWTFSQDAWNSTDKFYTNSRVINEDSLNWQDFIDGEAYHASVYYELNKTDAHGFTPTSIKLNDDGSVDVDGTGGDGTFEDFRGPYELGTTEFYGENELLGMTTVEFMVSNIVTADTEEDKSLIISFIESQQEIDTDLANEATGTVAIAAETFNAKSKNRKSGKRSGNRSTSRGTRRGQKAVMQRKSKLGKGISSYSHQGHAENFTTSKYAESFASESASDSIAAESSKAVEGINPTAVNDGTWLAETVNSRNAESKHDYAHRVIEGKDYVHYDGKGKQTRRTNRGKSISADRRKYSPNRNLKPGQGHMGDFVREAQGYNDRLDDSMGERNKAPRTGQMTMGDRRDMSKGMEKRRNRRPYAGDARMDRKQRRARAETSFNKRAESPMTSPETYKPTAYSPTSENPASAAPSSMGTGDQIISVSSPSAPPNDIKFAESTCSKCAETFNACGCSTRRAEMTNTPTNETPSGADPLQLGATTQPGSELVDVDSPSAPPSNIFEQSAESFSADWEPYEIQVESCTHCGGAGTKLETCLNCKGIGELMRVDGNRLRSGPVGCRDCGTVTNLFVQTDDHSSFREDSPSRIVVCESCIGGTSRFNAEMNYDGSLYGDQYFPDAITANQVNVGKLGSTASADGSGQGVLEWDGSRVGPMPDNMAAEMSTPGYIGRLGLGKVILASAGIGIGLFLVNSNLSK
jgi:hypothetical protein